MKSVLTVLTEAVLALAAAAVVLLLGGGDPLQCLGILWRMIVLNPKNIVNVIVGAAPIIITGIAISFAYASSLFNIGAEGQFIMASAAAAVVGASIDLPAPLAYPLVIVCGMAAGALYAGISGWLRARRGVSEVISGIMLNWCALHFSNYLIRLPALHDPNTQQTVQIATGALDPLCRWQLTEQGLAQIVASPLLREIVGRTSINLAIVYAVAAACVCAYILRRTTLGFRLRAVGLGAPAAELAGMDIKRSIMQSMMISGAIVGLAGALQVVGVSWCISTLNGFENYGFNGLSVALMAHGSALGCIPAGLLFSALTLGGRLIQAFSGTPSEVISIMIGAVVFMTAISPVIATLPDRLLGLFKRGRG